LQGGEYESDVLHFRQSRINMATPRPALKTLVVDTVCGRRSLSPSGTQSRGRQVFNAASFAGGVTLNGTAKPGSNRAAEPSGHHPVTRRVGEQWRMVRDKWAKAGLAAGEYISDVTIVNETVPFGK